MTKSLFVTGKKINDEVLSSVCDAASNIPSHLADDHYNQISDIESKADQKEIILEKSHN